MIKKDRNLSTFIRRLPSDVVYDQMKSPVGTLWLMASPRGLHALLWEDELKADSYEAKLSTVRKSPSYPVLKETRKQLKEYFAGKRIKFDLPLFIDGTPFQKQAWKELRKIPYGKTVSYQKQADKMGDPKKARAAGTANSKNPISIIVPCHRVIAKNGSLAGFAGGLDTKRYLLELEKKHV